MRSRSLGHDSNSGTRGLALNAVKLLKQRDVFEDGVRVLDCPVFPDNRGRLLARATKGCFQ